MRILLIAYEFPPIPSPQSLRWAYLVDELSRIGHDVNVLVPDHAGYGSVGGLPEIPESVTIHRAYAGHFIRALGWLQTIRRRKQPMPIVAQAGHAATSASSHAARAGEVALNWKGRLAERLQRVYASMLYPDVRAEWNPWARRSMRTLLRELCPDVVVVSHEPASVLSLGLEAKRMGHFVVADLGDPVCANYTPWRWRRRAWRLEQRICRSLDLITVTNQATRDLLIRRHGASGDRIHVMPQGYDDRFAREEGGTAPNEDSDVLEMLYTGSFYAFRTPAALIAAVMATPNVRLSIASSRVPPAVEEAALRYPEGIRLLGFVAHRAVLQLQREADVLVNIANADATQVPGKIYEYLGAGRPILHIGDNSRDEAAKLVREAGIGWISKNTVPELTHLLKMLVAHKVQLSAGIMPADPELIGKYAWSALAKGVVDRIETFRAQRANSRNP